MGILNNFKKSTENLLGALQQCDDLSIIDSAIAQLADTMSSAYKLKAQMKPNPPQAIEECGGVEVVRDSMRKLVDACLYDFDNKVKKNCVFINTWEPPHVQLPSPVDYMLMEAERSCKPGKVKNMFFTKKTAETYKKLYTQLPQTSAELTREAAEKSIRAILTHIEQNNLVPVEAKDRVPKWIIMTKEWQMMDVFDSSDVVLQEANRIRLAKEDGKRLRYNIFTFGIAERILQLYGVVYGETILHRLSEHIEATRVTSSDSCNSSNESPRRSKKRVLETPEEPMEKRPCVEKSSSATNTECEVERSSESPEEPSTSDNDDDGSGNEATTANANDNEMNVMVNKMIKKMNVKLPNDENGEVENVNDKKGFFSKIGLSFWSK